MTVARVTLRTIEDSLRTRIGGPRRTLDELNARIGDGLAALSLVDSASAASLAEALHDRRRSLARARVVLLHQERSYLQLAGVQDGRSVRRHLSRGLHLAFSAQEHRRTDRIAHLWTEASPSGQQAGGFYWAPEIPAAYAQHRRAVTFRLADAAAVRHYVLTDHSAARE